MATMQAQTPAVIRTPIQPATKLKRNFAPHVRLHPRPRIGNISNGWPDTRPMQDRLTERETEILALLAKGKCAKEIAVELNMAVKTVETHRARVYRKMETHTTVETVLLAIRLGMVACPCMGRERERADSWYFGA